MSENNYNMLCMWRHNMSPPLSSPVGVRQGSHASWKVWKVLDFFLENSRTWKVLENDLSWKVLEIKA